MSHDFATIMGYAGYTWESYEVATDDGWNLALYRITGVEGGEPIERASDIPVLVMHGFYMDG